METAGDSHERKEISWVDLCSGWLPGDCGLGDTTASLLGEERDERMPSELFWNSLRDPMDTEKTLVQELMAVLRRLPDLKDIHSGNT